MTVMDDIENQEDMSEKPEPKETKIILSKIGGFDLIYRRPVICKNKSLYVISGSNVRNYSTENGNFINQYKFGNQNKIVAVQQNPQNSDELIVVSESGLIVFWNYVDNVKSSESFLQINEAISKVSFFQQIGDTYYFVAASKVKGDIITSHVYYCHKSQLTNVSTISKHQLINNDSYKSIAFGPTSKPEYCAFIYYDKLYVHQIPIKVDSRSSSHGIFQNKYYTCIAFHPTDPVLATGDSIGQIMLWNDILCKTPAKTIMHWHSQQVNDMAFSPSGTFLYSVGNEKVLVQWNLVGQYFGQKSFLPRLGEKIKFIVVDPKMMIISHDDQSLQIIDSQMNGVLSVIEGLTACPDAGGKRTANLHYNCQLKALSMNGRVGHVQIYSPSRQKQLFQLDIAHQNLVSAVNMQSLKDRLENNNDELNKIYPIEVTKIAVSEDGNWLATIEYRNDNETLPEIRMKFWLLKQNDYLLNTTIHLPHQEEITYIAFSPVAQDGSIHLVSTSKDKSFKIWDLNIDDDKSWWNSSRNASLNSYSVPRLAAFSADVSLLTVLFDNIVTLWELDSPTSLRYIPRMDIFQLKKFKEIIFLSFGSNMFSHYLIEGYHSCVTVLNVLKKFELVFNFRKLSKEFEHQWVDITFNPYENVLALLSTVGIQFLSLETQNLIMNIDFAQVNFTSEIVASIFTPEKFDPKYEHLPLKCSTFYCLNEKNELFQAINADSNVYDAEDVALIGIDDSHKTKLYMQHMQNQLSVMLNNKAKSKPSGDNSLPAIVPNYEGDFEQNRKVLVEKYFYNVPSHVLPPVSMFEKSFLSSFLECLNITNDSTGQIKSTNSNSGQIDENSIHLNQHSSINKSNNNLKLKNLLDFEQELVLNDHKNDLVTENPFSWLANSFRKEPKDVVNS